TVRCGNGGGNAASPRFVDRPKSCGRYVSDGSTLRGSSGIWGLRTNEGAGSRKTDMDGARKGRAGSSFWSAGGSAESGIFFSCDSLSYPRNRHEHGGV